MTRGYGIGKCAAPGNGRWRAWLALALLLTWLSQAHADGVLVVASSGNELYSRFIDGFTTTLADDRPAGEATDVSVIYLDRHTLSDNDLATSGLVVTVGTRAARDVTALAPGIPLLHTIIPESVYLTLAITDGACAKQSAIFIDQPLARQAALARAMFPSAVDYGIPLGPTSSQRLPEISALEKITDRNLIVRLNGNEPDIAAAVNGLLEEADLLLAINDPVVLNRSNAKWLLYSAYQHRLPVIGFSQAYVTAGAAGAVFSEPEQMARQAAEIVRDHVNGHADCLPAAGFPRYFSVAVNQSVCDSLGDANCDEHALGKRLADGESPR